MRNTLEMVAQRNPAAKVDMNMSKYVDESTLDELEKEGFFQAAYRRLRKSGICELSRYVSRNVFR